MCLIICDTFIPFPLVESFPIRFAKWHIFEIFKIFDNFISQLTQKEMIILSQADVYQNQCVLLTNSNSFNSVSFSVFGISVPCRMNIHICRGSAPKLFIQIRLHFWINIEHNAVGGKQLPGILNCVSDMLRSIPKYDCTVDAERCKVSITFSPRHCLANRTPSIWTLNEKIIKSNYNEVNLIVFLFYKINSESRRCYLLHAGAYSKKINTSNLNYTQKWQTEST